MNDLPTPESPTGVIWETLIVDPRFQGRPHREMGKGKRFFWALARGSILIVVGIVVTAMV